MFELPTPTRVKVRKSSPRKQFHGEDLVQAIDLDLDWETSNECLAMFSPWLLDALYLDRSANNGQQAIEGIAASWPNLRLIGLEMPLKWDMELRGRDFRISHGLGGKSDLLLSTCTVKKLRITAKEGGTTVVGFQVQCDVDVNEKIVGRLCALEGEEIEATLMASEEAGDDDETPKLSNSPAWPDPDGALRGVPASKTPAAHLSKEAAWPFPKPDATDIFAATGAEPPPQSVTVEPDPAIMKGAKAFEKAVKAETVKAEKPPAKYRDAATGQTWSGRGLQPKWLKVALAQGKTLQELML